MKTNFFLSLGLALFISGSIDAQGVKIGATNGQPDGSAMLDVEAEDKGMLVPRLTTIQRDFIQSPANGLLIFNTTTNCFNFRVESNWFELCGTCTPQPTQASAGSDQLDLSGSSTILAANAVVFGSGTWSLISGDGGEFSNEIISSDPTAVFTGLPGNSYVLRWTTVSDCGSSFDETTISFVSELCDPNPPGTLLIPTSGWCDPAAPSGWTQCAGWINTSGDDVSNGVLDGCLNSNGRLRIKIWNASTGVLEEDVFSTNTNMSAWQSWNYHGGTITKNAFTNWTGTSDFFSSNGGGSACYFNANCGVDAPCNTLTLGTGNTSVILAPGATNQFEYRMNCNGAAFPDRIIAVYR